jgi:hypothetical protein
MTSESVTSAITRSWSTTMRALGNVNLEDAFESLCPGERRAVAVRGPVRSGRRFRYRLPVRDRVARPAPGTMARRNGEFGAKTP